jgi:hypothetical protein
MVHGLAGSCEGALREGVDLHDQFCGLLLSVAKRAIVRVSLMSDNCSFYLLCTRLECFHLGTMISML